MCPSCEALFHRGQGRRQAAYWHTRGCPRRDGRLLHLRGRPQTSRATRGPLPHVRLPWGVAAVPQRPAGALDQNLPRSRVQPGTRRPAVGSPCFPTGRKRPRRPACSLLAGWAHAPLRRAPYPPGTGRSSQLAPSGDATRGARQPGRGGQAPRACRTPRQSGALPRLRSQPSGAHPTGPPHRRFIWMLGGHRSIGATNMRSTIPYQFSPREAALVTNPPQCGSGKEKFQTLTGPSHRIVGGWDGFAGPPPCYWGIGESPFIC